MSAPDGGNIAAGVACGKAEPTSKAGRPIPRVGMLSNWPETQ